jgi:hypothetical protein
VGALGVRGKQTELGEIGCEGDTRCQLSSETSIHFQQTSQFYIPEDIILHNHRCENLKSPTVFLYGEATRSASCLFHADFLLGLLFNSENGGDLFLQTSVHFQRATWRYVLEGIIL